MTKVIFIDTETTSLNTERCGLIQIAGIVEIEGEVKEEFDIRSALFQDDFVDKEALQKNQFTLVEISKYPKPAAAFSSLCKILGKYVDQYDPTDKFTAIGYFADFDNRVLRSWFQKNRNNYFGSWFWHPWIDVANIAAFVLMERRMEIVSFKLSSLSEYLGIPFDENKLHDALCDVRITRDIYKNLTES